jgi:hypothetical protein
MLLKYFLTILKKGVVQMKRFFTKILPLFVAILLLVVFISPSLAFGANVNENNYAMTSSGFVMMYYNNVLNRNPATAEVDAWVKRLSDGTFTGHSFIEDLVFSTENKSAISSITNEDFVKWLYMAILMREPDKAGQDEWLMKMKNGWDKDAVVDGFVKSDEFVNICKNFKVQPFSSAETKGQSFSAIMSGENEVPAILPIIPLDAFAAPTGSAVFSLSADGKSLTYKITVENIVDAQAAHIHWAVPGVNGPVVAALFPTASSSVKTGEFSGVLAEGTIMAKDLLDVLKGKTIADLVKEIKAGKAYVNVHNLEHPAGAMRGQIK